MSHGITIRSDGFAEAVFSLQPAWHRLGKVYDKPMTSKDILESEILNWTVEQRPAGYKTKDGQWVEQPEYMWNVRSDNEEILGLVSDHYQIVQNVEAFSFLDALVEEGELLYESAFSLYGGRRVVVVARTPGYEEVVKGDYLLPYIHLSLCHDGKGAITFGPVHVRMVCANTYAVGLREGNSLSVRHSGDVKEKLKVAREILALSHNSFVQYANLGRQLSNRKLSATEWQRVLNSLFPVPQPGSSDYTERRVKKINQIREKIEAIHNSWRNNIPGMEESAWAAYNAVAEFVDHVERRGADPRQKAETQYNTIILKDGKEIKEMALREVMDIVGLNKEVSLAV